METLLVTLQLGTELWSSFASQQRARSAGAGTSPGGSSSPYGWLAEEESEFFRASPTGRRTARCLLVDTEPKVVRSALSNDSHAVFAKDRCFLGQSGRGWGSPAASRCAKCPAVLLLCTL